MNKEIQKTIKAKIHKPTKSKRERLGYLYREWNKCLKDFLKGKTYEERREKYEIHSHYVDDVELNVRTSERPVYIRPKDLKVKETDNEIAKYFARIPIEPYELIWLPVKIPEKYEKEIENHKGAELIKKGGEFWLHIFVEKEAPETYKPKGVFALDPGSRWLAVGVAGSDNKPFFFGEEIRRIRGKYYRLRKTKGDFSKKEENKIEDQIHKITKWIVRFAKENKLAIVVGDVKDVKGDSGRGKAFNRRVNNMPSFKLKQYLEYKCREEGVPFELIDEKHTTQKCSRCGYLEGRPNGKMFKCSICGLEIHSDRNGAINIKKQGLDKFGIEPMSKSGAFLVKPKTPEPIVNYSKSDSRSGAPEIGVESRGNLEITSVRCS